MEFSRPEYWTGFPFPSPGDLSSPGIEPRSPALQEDSLPAEPPGKAKNKEVGSLSLLQGIFQTQESNWSLLHCRRFLYQLSYHLGSPKGNSRYNQKPAASHGTAPWSRDHILHGHHASPIPECPKRCRGLVNVCCMSKYRTTSLPIDREPPEGRDSVLEIFGCYTAHMINKSLLFITKLCPALLRPHGL